MNWRSIGIFGLTMSLSGCGTDTPDAKNTDAIQPNTDSGPRAMTDRTYPYTGEHGETVCAEWERIEEGARILQKEFYHLEVMNQHLSGEGTIDSRVIAAMKQAGLTRVATCDDARRFTRIEREVVESHPAESSTNAGQTGTQASPPSGTSEGPMIDKVADGANNFNAAVVRVQPFDAGAGAYGTCSGVIISPTALLTAAHCFFASGNWHVRVDHGRGTAGGPTASVDCVSASSACTDPPTGPTNAVVTRFPGFTGFLDSARDLAVVVSNTPWRAPVGMMRITASAVPAGDSYFVNGYGAHADTGSGLGIHRQALSAQGIDSAFTGYWRDATQSGVGRPCKGDSGGPAINTTRLNGSPGGLGNTMAIGLFNNFDNGNGGFCPSPGEKFRYTRIEDKLGFIQSLVPSCTPGSFNGWNFRQCF